MSIFQLFNKKSPKPLTDSETRYVRAMLLVNVNDGRYENTPAEQEAFFFTRKLACAYTRNDQSGFVITRQNNAYVRKKLNNKRLNGVANRYLNDKDSLTLKERMQIEKICLTPLNKMRVQTHEQNHLAMEAKVVIEHFGFNKPHPKDITLAV